jgi:signal transduction histidine kinase
MQNNFLFQARQNRLIASVRVFQAGISLASVWAEPDKPGILDDLVFYLLGGYLALAAASWVVARYWRGRHETMFLAMLGLDAVVFAVALYLTAGSTSPFFSIFLLIALSATLQWGWRGAAAATGVALLVFVPTALPAYQHATGFRFDPPRFILRVGTLLSVGGLLLAYGRHQDRVASDMLRLSGAQLRPEASEEAPVWACLEHALTVFGLKRGAFVWGDPEEPGLTLDELSPEGRRRTPLAIAPGQDHPSLDGAEEPFFFDPAGPAAVSLGRDGRMKAAPDDVLTSPALRELATSELTLVLPVRAAAFAGWIVLKDVPVLDRESLVLGSTVAAQAAVTIGSWRSLMVWRDAAAAQQRVRLARDIHDGTLQFLAGASMQLEALARRLGDGERDQIRRLQDDLKAEQRQLRALIGSTADIAPDHRRPADFDAEVKSLISDLSRRWNADIRFESDLADRPLPAPLVFELLQVVREAISNAVRHGRARTVAIRVADKGGELELVISDDGVGMPAHGVFGMAQLKDLMVGPRTLRSRVAGLGGDLVVESGPDGVTLRIAAPLGAPLAMEPG